MQSIFTKYGINHYSTNTKTPWKASMAERAIRTIKNRLQKYFYQNKNNKWIDFLPQIIKQSVTAYSYYIKTFCIPIFNSLLLVQSTYLLRYPLQVYNRIISLPYYIIWLNHPCRDIFRTQSLTRSSCALNGRQSNV